MKILFDFELFGDAHIDAQLLDVMLAVKAEVHLILAGYKEKISDESGMVLVTLRPKHLSMRYFSAAEADHLDAVQQILERFDWNSVIESHIQLSMN